jgi:molybdopterin-guanine dinucleotide biosynthesis protein A
MTSSAVIHGLVLAGGASSRMKRDKAALLYAGKSQLDRAVELAARCVDRVFVSVRPSQSVDATRARYPLIVDSLPGQSPLIGIRSALAAEPAAAWLVIACDLPFLGKETLSRLLAERDPGASATAYSSSHDGLPEPLCALWEPRSAPHIDAFLATGKDCPRKFLINHPVRLLALDDPRALDNVNTPEEYDRAVDLISPVGSPAPQCN